MTETVHDKPTSIPSVGNVISIILQFSKRTTNQNIFFNEYNFENYKATKQTNIQYYRNYDHEEDDKVNKYLTYPALWKISNWLLMPS